MPFLSLFTNEDCIRTIWNQVVLKVCKFCVCTCSHQETLFLEDMTSCSDSLDIFPGTFTGKKMNGRSEPRCFVDLPDTVQVKIFRYLGVDDLCRIGRTCKKMYHLSRQPRFWTRVDSGDYNLKTMSYNRIKRFIRVLPSTITHLKLRYIPCDRVEFTERDVFLPIKERCPNLKVLVFHACFLSYKSENRDIFCIFDQLPKSVRIFAFQKGELESFNFLTDNWSVQFYPIVVLDLSDSVLPRDQNFFRIFERMVNLTELRLAKCAIWDNDVIRLNPYVMSNLKILDLEDAKISYVAFQFISVWCIKLEQLYLCDTTLTDDDIIFEEVNNLEVLEKICIRGTAVSDVGIVRLLSKCQSLKHIYVSYHFQLPRTSSVPRSLTNKVRSVMSSNSCKHYTKRNYMRENF